MASTLILLSRDQLRNRGTKWLADAISPEGRATAARWHEWRPGGRLGPLTVRGALAIALIRAELRRRAAAEPVARVAYVEIDRVTEYGATARLSRSVRVF